MGTTKFALKGSSKIVADFFEFCIYSILYQRGIYSSENFQIVKKYGINMVVSTDEDVKAYLKKVMIQLNKWVYKGKITKLVVPIISKDTDEVVERWEFELEVKERHDSQELDLSQRDEIQKEIQALIRQITASVTFLPTLDGAHTFNILVYTDPDSKVPYQWIDTNGDGKEISDSELIKFKSFSTSEHKVGAAVSYKNK